MLAAWTAYFNIALLTKANAFFEANPNLKIQPVSQSIDISGSLSPNLVYLGLNFGAPWQNPSVINAGDSVRIAFNGNKFIIISKETTEFKPSFLSDRDFQTWQKNSNLSPKAFMKKSLNTLPSDIKVSVLRKNIIDKIMLLDQKAQTLGTDAIQKIESFETPSIRGFLFLPQDKSSTKAIFFLKDQSYVLTTNAAKDELIKILGSIKSEE